MNAATKAASSDQSASDEQGQTASTGEPLKLYRMDGCVTHFCTTFVYARSAEEAFHKFHHCPDEVEVERGIFPCTMSPKGPTSAPAGTAEERKLRRWVLRPIGKVRVEFGGMRNE